MSETNPHIPEEYLSESDRAMLESAQQAPKQEDLISAQDETPTRKEAESEKKNPVERGKSWLDDKLTLARGLVLNADVDTLKSMIEIKNQLWRFSNSPPNAVTVAVSLVYVGFQFSQLIKSLKS